jgi:hypothetical protein
MTKPRIQQGTISPVRIIFALATLWFVWSLAAASAKASCSDYVTLGRGVGGHTVGPERGPIDHPFRPCHGPECGRRLPAPLPPNVPVRIVVFDVWTGLRLPLLEAGPSSVLFQQAILRLPLAVAPHIDRPPRSESMTRGV